MNIRRQITRGLKIQESVATTIFHDFYGSRTGINNRLPICPQCGLQVNDGIYGEQTADASLRDGKRCQCNELSNPPKR